MSVDTILYTVNKYKMEPSLYVAKKNIVEVEILRTPIVIYFSFISDLYEPFK